MVSLYPYKCPKRPPTLTNTYTAKPQQHTSGTHQIITPQQQPKGSRNTCNPQKPLRKTLQLQPQLEKQPLKTEADIAILMDSNGKFLQEEKLFPGRKVTKLWCPKTGDALRILSDSSFGTPSHIIIHTGTNDLRREQERVGQLICRVAEKATET